MENAQNAEEVPSTNKWVKENRLGSGTFGLVVLWRNEQTNFRLALKHYKGSMDQKNAERWVKEVNIMKTLKHPNIVRAFEVPEQLQDSSNQLPVLAMEYCEGGDLRRVFSRPESSYGFSQLSVITILSQIADGLFYLHERDVIHRDLKPENIVLKPMPDGSIVYKIIDLGYAKDIGHGSIPLSFAGTLQYAAPDLLQKKPYDKSVDFWSLGILCFEMIVGRRPFSPVDNDPVVGWYNSISSRPESCVCMMEDVEGKVTFSPNLPVHNNMSRNYRKLFEVWLQNMFLLEPTKRGKLGPKEGQYASAPWYGLLKQIVNTEEYKVLDMTSNKLLVYHENEIKTVTDLHINLFKEDEANIRLEQQELLLPDGKIAMQTDRPVKRKEDANLDLPDYFLFRKSSPDNVQDINLKSSPLPAMAEILSQNPLKVITQARIRQRMWSECLYVCKTMVKEAVDIQEGIRAIKMNFMRQFKEMTNCRHKLTKTYRTVLGKHEFFKASVAWDLQSYVDQAECGINSEKMHGAWSDSKERFSELPEELKLRFQELCTRADGLGNVMVEIKDYPKKTQHQENLDKCKVQSEALYIKLRKELKEGPPKDVNCTELVQCMMQSRQEREKLGEKATEQIMKLISCRDNAVQIRQEMEDANKQLELHSNQMMSHQKKRQFDVWMSVKFCNEMYKKLKSSNQRNEEFRTKAEEGMEPTTLEAATITSPGTIEPATLTSSRSSVTQMMSRDFTSPESLRAVEDSLTTRDGFTEAVDRYSHESNARLKELESLNWEFD
uniref:IkappaB kinase n=1 Tax=Holothuria leucospilota TaxID=206669 RepID=A0A7D3U898_HOLLE|nr:inhibitor of nuclear factor kappa B kinase subunit beta [Holothuria leucospilota]